MSLIRADARSLPLVDGCVDCCVTSPPLGANPVHGVAHITESLHLNRVLDGPRCGPDVASFLGDALFLAGVLNSPEKQAVISLVPFDSQVWQDGSQERRGLHVGDLPSLERLAALRGRLRSETITTERLQQQVNGMRFDLFNAHTLRVGRLRRVTDNTHRIRAPFDANRTVSVDNTGAVSEDGFVHN